jgi:hypothetical protein
MTEPDKEITEILNDQKDKILGSGFTGYDIDGSIGVKEATQAIQALIDKRCREARIDALDDAYGYWHMHGGRKTGQFIKERIADLKPTVRGEPDDCEYGCKGAGKHYHDPTPKSVKGEK